MPLDNRGRVGSQVNQPTAPSSSQSPPVQDTRSDSAKHKSRFISILQDVGSYLAGKFSKIKDFFKGLGSRDVKKTSSSRYETPDTGTAFPSFSERKAKKVKNEPPEPITSGPAKFRQSVPTVKQDPKKLKERPLDATDYEKQDDSQDVDPTLRYRATPDQPENQGETVNDLQNSEELSQLQIATPPIIPKQSSDRHRNTEYSAVTDPQDTTEISGMAAFEKKMNQPRVNFDEYQQKRNQVPEVKPPEVKKQSLFSRFLSFLGIRTTSTKKSKVRASSMRAAQNIKQNQPSVINLIQKAQDGAIDGLPAYYKAYNEITKQETTLAKWLPYIFPRYRDGNTKVAGIDYGFAGITDVINFSKDDTFFLRLIKCSLEITRDSTNNGESKAIHSILDTENCKYFRDSMQVFLNFVQSEDCKNKEVLDAIVKVIAGKDCIQFFSDAIAIVDKEIKSTT